MAGARVTPVSALTTPEGIASVAEEVEPGSLLDRLRTRAARAQETRTLDLDVPGWGGELVLRFRPIDIGALDRFLERRAAGTPAPLSESVDVMASSCFGVFGRDAGRLVELRDREGPIRLDYRLAVLLAMPGADETFTAREVALWLFRGEAFALGAFVDRLVTWMADPDAEPKPGES